MEDRGFGPQLQRLESGTNDFFVSFRTIPNVRNGVDFLNVLNLFDGAEYPRSHAEAEASYSLISTFCAEHIHSFEVPRAFS